ncbi:uncharacterized protein N7503_009548 [Penicillium pulvis]|uniref:uncharacterized protein n=1 Tax=Penicillium pulvis TaxID=1562058 RepID=UPI00254788A6|nr:uncharacterized protein N7503_009548 [Penicillium pulvis]KAJ5784336.1 hypothetical protein N7503_009548 [Penicillium pulvis]
MESQRILVIGGTGAQGTAVVKSLLEAEQPYRIRILTRNPADASTVAKFPTESGVELVKGSFMDMKSVESALQDCYGVFVNTDGFTVKEADEIWAAMRIYEIAKACPTLRHIVWSGLDYYLKLGKYDQKYASYHINAKARVNDWLRAQESSHENHGVAWTILNTGPYMEMLYGGVFIPQIEADGTRVYSLPLGKGKLPLIALPDLGFFARIIFENRSEWSGQTLGVVSQFVTGDEIAETLTKVTGIPAVYKPCSGEEWVDQVPWASEPVAKMDPSGPTHRDNWLMWWRAYEDDLLLPERDMVRLKALNPDLRTLETWMKETNYDGQTRPLLRGHEF